MVRRTMEYQDLYGNQNFGAGRLSDPTTVAATTDDQTQTWSVAPQAPVCRQILCSSYLAETSSSRTKRMLGMHL